MALTPFVLDIQLVISLGGVLAFVALLRRGYLGREVFEGCPTRPVKIGLADLWLGIAILLLGMVAASQIFFFLGWLGSEDSGDGALIPSREVQRALLGQALTQLPVAIFFLYQASRSPKGLWAVGLVPSRPGRDVKYAAVALVAVLPMVMGLGIWIHVVTEWYRVPSPQYGHDLLRALAQARSPRVVAGFMVSAVVVAPLLEELIYRGLFQTSLLQTLGRSRRWVVVLASAFVFTIIHAGVPWQVLPGLWVLGVFLGWLYEYTGSLWPGILLHAGFNAANSGLVYVIRCLEGG